MANEAIPLFRPGSDVTAVTTGAVVGKTFVGISANRGADGLIRVNTATAATRAIGVAVRDVASGGRVAVIAGPGTIVPVTAGGAITAGAQVEVGANGRAVALASGIAVGLAVETGTNGNAVLVRIY